MKIKIIEFAVFLSLLISVISCISFENDCDSIRQKVMRLHVIANSDTEEDQNLKLKVRDSILTESGNIFSVSDNLSDAEKSVINSLIKLERCAEKAVSKEGYSYKVNVSFEPSYFPTRTYENVTLPAGIYKSLKVTIGEGAGKNWWCVLFPPMCLTAAMDEKDVLSAVLNEDELSLVSSKRKYEVRFWIIEKFQEFKRTHKSKA